MKIFFNSSMPRSGSTLLQNILGNNPQIYSTPTSGLHELLSSSRVAFTKSPNFKAQDDKQMKSAFLHYCRYGMEGYFEGLTNKPYVMEKSRAWIGNKAFLEAFYPNPKIVCMVRDLRDVVASMEKNFRKNPHKAPIQDGKGDSIGERVGLWLTQRPIGTQLKVIRDAILTGAAKDILFIKYENLCQNPQKEIDKVHKFLGVQPYEYDFDNIVQVTHEDDKFHGIYGDHKIRSKIEPLQSNYLDIFGQEISTNIYIRNKWYFDYFKYEK